MVPQSLKLLGRVMEADILKHFLTKAQAKNTTANESDNNITLHLCNVLIFLKHFPKHDCFLGS
jgi:hypothetical protein